MEKKINLAFELFRGGFNCAQSVVGPFCPTEKRDAQLVMKLASGFGGGMRCGEVCGAVTGALMAIGLKEGQCLAGDLDAKRKTGKLTAAFMEEYEQRQGTLLCRDLLGYDVRDPEASTISKERKREICEHAIKTAILLLEEMGIK